jgi:hypothetical protein
MIRELSGMENIQIFDLAREEHKSELFGCMSVR